MTLRKQPLVHVFPYRTHPAAIYPPPTAKKRQEKNRITLLLFQAPAAAFILGLSAFSGGS